MRILLATDCYIFQTGGITNVVLTLENGLRKIGQEVKVFALSNSFRSYRDGDRYFIRSLPFPDYPEHRVTLSAHDPFLKELAEWKPDVVHIHTEFTAGWLAKRIAQRSGAPVIMTTHTDFEYFIFGRFRNAPVVKKLAGIIGKRVYREAVTVIVPSEKARAFPHLAAVADKVKVISNGIALERYRKAVSSDERNALFRQAGFMDHGYTLVMVTRLSKEKNVIEILSYLTGLLQVLPEVQLLIVGDGPDRKRLESFCSRNRLDRHVHFAGRIPPEDVYRYYDMGELFVSASTFELHSMSYLEAMACGLPLVCREDPSLMGVLQNGDNGFIYRNEQEFIAGVCEILEDRSLREQMGSRSLHRAEMFSDQLFVEKTLGLYHSVCRQNDSKVTIQPSLHDKFSHAKRGGKAPTGANLE